MLPLKVLCRLPVSRDRGSAGLTSFSKEVSIPTSRDGISGFPASRPERQMPGQRRPRPALDLCPSATASISLWREMACAREGGIRKFKVLLSPLRRSPTLALSPACRRAVDLGCEPCRGSSLVARACAVDRPYRGRTFFLYITAIFVREPSFLG